jgi:hypothetical protein
MIYSKIAPLPRHLYCWVDSRFTHEEPIGFVEAMWVGLTSIPGRTWGVSVLLRDGGALYRNLPPHAIYFHDPQEKFRPPKWEIHQAQLWDCYSYHFTLLRNDHLCLGLRAKVGDDVLSGEYLFSAAHLLDGYSDSPDQDKEFIFAKLDNGRLTIQPTNRVVFTDNSFTLPTDSLPRLKLSEVIYSCE